MKYDKKKVLRNKLIKRISELKNSHIFLPTDIVLPARSCSSNERHQNAILPWGEHSLLTSQAALISKSLTAQTWVWLNYCAWVNCTLKLSDSRWEETNFEKASHLLSISQKARAPSFPLPTNDVDDTLNFWRRAEAKTPSCTFRLFRWFRIDKFGSYGYDLAYHAT